MSHTLHIAKNKDILILRSDILRYMREWFWNHDFLEVETPLILRLPGQEPYLSPMKVTIHDETGQAFDGFLHTSPEYAMKKMLGAGFTNIFFLGKTFRDYESFGGTHNPEFTMIEWYRANADFTSLMSDTESLCQYLAEKVNSPNELLKKPWKRIHMRDLWREYININLDEYLTHENMLALCREKGYNVEKDEAYEDLFYRIFLNEIEPHLGKDAPTIVHHYPACMAALAKISSDDPQYAERFEIYINGLELANAFSELTDAAEQRKRLEEEQQLRKTLGKDIYPIDEAFLEALDTMPPSAGIALGVDRLVQLLTGCQNINDVLVLPASQLFKD